MRGKDTRLSNYHFPWQQEWTQNWKSWYRFVEKLYINFNRDCGIVDCHLGSHTGYMNFNYNTYFLQTMVEMFKLVELEEKRSKPLRMTPLMYNDYNPRDTKKWVNVFNFWVKPVNDTCNESGPIQKKLFVKPIITNVQLIT